MGGTVADLVLTMLEGGVLFLVVLGMLITLRPMD